MYKKSFAQTPTYSNLFSYKFIPLSSFASPSLPRSVSDMTISVKDALSQRDDRRVKATRPLIPPAILQEDLPL